MENLNNVYDLLKEYEIATEDELDLVTMINGWKLESFESIIYARTGLNSIDQLCEDLGVELD